VLPGRKTAASVTSPAGEAAVRSREATESTGDRIRRGGRIKRWPHAEPDMIAVALSRVKFFLNKAG